MENLKSYKIKDLRQSINWSKYLNWLGWYTKTTRDKTPLYIRKIPFISVSKLQRPQNLSDKKLKEIENICLKEKVSFVKVEPVSKKDVLLLKKHGYVQSSFPLLAPTTIVIDLTKDKDSLWKDVRKSGRYSIRRAKREGARVEFHRKPSIKALKLFLDLANQTGKRHKILVPSLEDLKKKVKIFDEDCFVMLVKDKNGEYMGAHFCLGAYKNIWYINGGTSEKGRGGKWGYYLLWESILHFKKLGYRFIDLEGVDDDRFPRFTKNWGGFSYFKERFGGSRIVYPRPHIKVFSPTLKLLQKVYKTLPL